MGVYTKGGDKGTTDLIGSVRVDKDHQKVRAYGTSDEISASLGMARSLLDKKSDQNMMLWIQKRLLSLNAELASTEEVRESLPDKVTSEDVRQLENWVDALTDQIPKFSTWIIAGDDPVSSAIHLSRTVTRRAEREIVALNHVEEQSPYILEFMNRLSDFLFQFSRKVQMDMQVEKIKLAVESSLMMGESKSGKLNLAEKIIQAAKVKASMMGLPVTIAVVDESGHLISLSRMDGCLLGSLDIAQSKARTSVLLEMTTEMVGKLSQPGEVLFGIENSNGGLTPFGGGIPIMLKTASTLWGGIGVSGGSVEEDIIIATAGLEVLREADE